MVVIFIGITALIKPAKAQGCQGMDSLLLDPRFDIEILLPRFDSLNMIALAASHTIKQEQAAMRSNQWTERYTRWIWAQNLSVFYNYSFW